MKILYSIVLRLSFVFCVFTGTTIFAQQSPGRYLPADTFNIDKNAFLDTLKKSCSTHAVLKKISSVDLNKLEQAIKAIPQVNSVSIAYGKRKSDFFVAYEAYNDRKLIGKMHEVLPAIQIESSKGCPYTVPARIAITNY